VCARNIHVARNTEIRYSKIERRDNRRFTERYLGGESSAALFRLAGGAEKLPLNYAFTTSRLIAAAFKRNTHLTSMSPRVRIIVPGECPPRGCNGIEGRNAREWRLMRLAGNRSVIATSLTSFRLFIYLRLLPSIWCFDASRALISNRAIAIHEWRSITERASRYFNIDRLFDRVSM